MTAKKSKSQRKEKPPGKIADSALFTAFENNRYLPYILFSLLSILYFAPLIFQNNSLITSETGLKYYGEVGGSFKNFSIPWLNEILWRPYLGGMPYAATLIEFNLRFLRNIFEIPFFDFRAYSLAVVCLTIFAGISLFIYLRTIGINRILAVILGVVFQFSPHFMSFTYSGHLSKMGVIAMLPLLFTFLYKGMHSRKLKYFLWLGLLIAVDIFFAHLQMVHFSLLALGFYFIYLLVTMFWKEKNYKNAIILCSFFSLSIILGLGIGARGFIPQYFHTKQDSKRAGSSGEGMSKEAASSFSLHAEEIASLIIPEFGNYDIPADRRQLYWGKNFFKINADYFGGVIFILSLLSLMLFRRNGEVRFFFVLMLIGISFSLGGNNPVFIVMYYLVPGMKSFRAPSLMIFVSAYSSFILAAIFLNHLLKQKTEKMVRITGYTFAALALLCAAGSVMPELYLAPWKALFYSGMPEMKSQILERNIPEMKTGFLIAFLFFTVFAAGFLLYEKKKIRYRYLILIILPVLLIDFWRIDWDFMNYAKVTPGVDPSGTKDPAYEYLRNLEGEPFRVMPMHIRSLNDRTRYPGVYMVTGFHDFTLRRYDAMMRAISQFGNNGLLHFVNLNAGKYVVYPQDIPGAVVKSDRYSVVKNDDALPYFYVRSRAEIIKEEQNIISALLSKTTDYHNTAVIEEEPPAGFESLIGSDQESVEFSVETKLYELTQGQVEVDVSLNKKGLFVFSENYHDNWTCRVDGEYFPVQRVNYLFQGVYLEPGEHTIRFEFVNSKIRWSRQIMYISFGVFLVLILLVQTGILERKQKENS